MKYFAVSFKTNNTIPWIDTWPAGKLLKMRCRHDGCYQWIQPVDVTVPEFPESIRKSYLLSYCNIAIDCMHDRLIEVLGGELCQQALVFGRLMTAGGQEIPNWKTFFGQRKLILRGSSNVKGGLKQTFGICPVCKAVKYYPLVKPFYALANQVGEEPIYTSNVYPLILRVDMAERLKNLRIREAKLVPLTIKDAPLDGLPAVLK